MPNDPVVADLSECLSEAAGAVRDERAAPRPRYGYCAARRDCGLNPQADGISLQSFAKAVP